MRHYAAGPSVTRRYFLSLAGSAVGLTATSMCHHDGADGSHTILPQRSEPAPASRRKGAGAVTVFLAGDVMTGRGIDQILPHSVSPTLYESYVKDARQYVELAEQSSGSIPKQVGFDYVWGDALAELREQDPDARIVNLETSITTSHDPARKGIHYRMHPRNVPVLNAAGIDGCIVANNHVLDWGTEGLRETLETLHAVGIQTAGAGLTAKAAVAPAVIEAESASRRILVFAVGTPSSGIPAAWKAASDRPGVHWLERATEETAKRVAHTIRSVRRAGDLVVLSIHWGGNWGYAIPDDHIAFAHTVVDEAGVDIVFGHSSHHAKGIELYNGSPILYGAGDLLNDYEGISGHEAYRGELALMYFVTMEGGRLLHLVMTPMRLRRLRLERASDVDARWLERTLDRECSRFGVRVIQDQSGRLTLRG